MTKTSPAQITLRLPPEELEQIRSSAANCGLTINGFIRRCCKDAEKNKADHYQELRTVATTYAIPPSENHIARDLLVHAEYIAKNIPEDVFGNVANDSRAKFVVVCYIYRIANDVFQGKSLTEACRLLECFSGTLDPLRLYALAIYPLKPLP